jgi:peroxiredoxin
MIELGELERRHEAFARRQVRVVAVSLEEPDEAKRTQEEFPHLVVVADSQRNLISAAEVVHKGVAKGGEDAAAPTTILVDRQGMVRWLYRPRQVLSRLSANEVLDAVDEHLSRGGEE